MRARLFLSFLALPLVVSLASLPVARVAAAEEAGFKPIFDGKTLEGWDGDPRFWRVEDGAITGETTPQNPTRGNTFIIWRQGELDDFELKLEYRITGGNSGIQYRSWEDPEKWGKWVIGGYQADLEAGDTWSGACYGERYRGILAKRGEKTVIGADHKPKVVGRVGDPRELQAAIKKNDWNEYHIIARGHHFIHKINGRVTCEVTDEDKEMRRRGGLLALQLHAGPPMKVQFRNIRLKRLHMKDKRKVVFVAGRKSHGYGAHEHNAGCLLLKKKLDESMPSIHAVVYVNHWPEDKTVMDPGGWPRDPTAFDNADAIVLYMDGGGGHPVLRHLEEVDALMKKGVGLACLHYAVEVPKGKAGDYFLDWIGGYFETWWSVNPHWTLENPKLAEGHPITRGVKPFRINDEWYYHMRFRKDMEGVTPILSAHPPKDTLRRPDGPHSGNPHVRAAIERGEIQHVAWARERPDGGRGFGFTGGHVHWNWRDDDFRKLVLNAIVWIAKGEVPPEGVVTKTPTREELEANQDYPPPGRRRRAGAR